MSSEDSDRRMPRLGDEPSGGREPDSQGLGEGDADAAARRRDARTPARPTRDSADIAQLLRALNDDLRDDPPPPPPRTSRFAVNQPYDNRDGSGDGRGDDPDAARHADEADDADGGPAATGSPAPSRPGRPVPSRPPLVVIALGLLAVAAMGLAAIVVTGGPKTVPGDTVAPLIVAAPSPAAPSLSQPRQTPPAAVTSAPATSAAVTSAPAPPALAPAPVPAAPSSVAPGRPGTPPRNVDPDEGTVSVLSGKSPVAAGPTTTVVRPIPEPAAGTSATVMVTPPSVPEPAIEPAPSRPLTQPAVPKPRAPVAVTKPPPAAPSTAPPAPAGGGAGHYAVQVGSYSVAANADGEVQRLARQGWTAYAVDWEDSHGRKWRAVRVGNFPTDAAARKAQADIKAKLAISGQVVNIR